MVEGNCQVNHHPGQYPKNESNLRVHFKAKVDFKVIRTLGKGAFGCVYLVQRRLTKDLYAMKVVEIGKAPHKDVLHDLAN